MPGDEPPPFEAFLGGLGEPVRERLRALTAAAFVPRLWKRDPTLWKPDARNREASARRLGWLGSVGIMQAESRDLASFAREAAGEGFTAAFLLGMGGAGTCAGVLASIFGAASDALDLLVLDTTDPAAILAVERTHDLRRVLFVVASKSGTTEETLALLAHFRDRLRLLGVPRPGSRFVAITDPETPLEALAREQSFRKVYLNPPDIGGRYSALSFFGLVPAALLGVNLPRLLDRAARVSAACGPSRDLAANPGVRLGAILAEAALAGRDKITFIVSPEIAPFGRWAEHLLAESTGKDGRGLLPVEGEAPAPPGAYGADRFFVHLRLRAGENQAIDAAAAALKEAGHPMVRLDLEDAYDVGAEFLRWEIATATVGAILEVNPFDEPDVAAGREMARQLLQLLADEGRLPEREPFLRDGPFAFHAAPERSEKLKREAAARGWPAGAAGTVAAHLLDASRGDYVALTAFLAPQPSFEGALQKARHRIRDGLKKATTLGFGPRFLHATGQYHKGGPDRGLFIQITADDPLDLEIPDRPYTFGLLKRAQAGGDLAALTARQRRVLRVHVSGDAAPGLQDFERAMGEAVELLLSAGT